MSASHWSPLSLGCRVTRSPRLSEFLDGQLSAADRAKVQSHVQGCDECREELRMLHLLSQRAATVGTRGRSDRPISETGSNTAARFGHDPALADRVLREVARRRGRHVARLDPAKDSIGAQAPAARSWTSRRAVAAAAAVLICSLASGVLGYSLGRQTPPTDPANDANGSGPVYFVDTKNGAQDTDLQYPIYRPNALRDPGEPNPGKLRRADTRWDQPIDAQPAGWRNR